MELIGSFFPEDWAIVGVGVKTFLVYKPRDRGGPRDARQFAVTGDMMVEGDYFYELGAQPGPGGSVQLTVTPPILMGVMEEHCPVVFRANMIVKVSELKKEDQEQIRAFTLQGAELRTRVRASRSGIAMPGVGPGSGGQKMPPFFPGKH
jgi:hypothetical protein